MFVGFRKKDPPVTPAMPFELAEPEKHRLTNLDWVKVVECHEQHVSSDGSIVTLIGTCPRCTHQMSVELPIKARTGKGVSQKKDGQSLGKKKQFKKVAFCNCGTAHEGRPEDHPSGCGAFGALLVGGNAGKCGEGRYVSVEGKLKTAAIHDVAWERKAETEAGQVLATARSAAEKWTQTIASLTGVFSIVLLVKGPDDITKVQGEVNLFGASTMPAWLINVSAFVAAGLIGALVAAHMTKSASRAVRWWLLVLLAVILAGLMVVWVESWSHFTLIVVLLASAVALAATAIIAGGLAAFGLPSGFIAASGAILRHRQMKQTLLTRSLLRGSLYTASLTLALVGVAIVLTWTQTGSATPTSVLVVSKTTGAVKGQVLCGPVASVEPPDGLRSGSVAVDTSNGNKRPETLPIARVALLATVSSCGRAKR
jgi:hypothetical protein